MSPTSLPFQLGVFNVVWITGEDGIDFMKSGDIKMKEEGLVFNVHIKKGTVFVSVQRSNEDSFYLESLSVGVATGNGQEANRAGYIQKKLKYTRLFDTANFNSQIPLKLYESKCDAFVVASEENNVPVVSVHNLPREGHKGALLMELPNLVNQKKFNLEKQEGWSIQLSGLAVSLHTDLEAQPFQFQLRSPSHPRPDKKEYSTGAFSLNHAFAPAARKFRRGRMYSAQIFVD